MHVVEGLILGYLEVGGMVPLYEVFATFLAQPKIAEGDVLG